jgi:SAM-dependent methyltransferase
MAVTRDEVAAGYELIVGEAPTQDQINTYVNDCQTSTELRARIFQSPQFHARVLGSVIPMCKPLDWPPLRIDVDVAPDLLRRMIDRVERTFRFLGETEPHWSVLSAERFRAANIDKTEDEFFASGSYDVDRLRQVADRCGIKLSDFQSCFELGCGVGRTTRWLADAFDVVIGADISPSHLEIARQTMRRFGKLNVLLQLVDSIAALETVPRFDVFLSVIVLQHNPPPLIAHLLKTVLGKLRPGGLAYFQVPTYHFGYTFDAEAYVANELKLGSAEMHVLPQHVVLDIANRAGCVPLEVREDTSGAYGMISQRFFLRKAI